MMPGNSICLDHSEARQIIATLGKAITAHEISYAMGSGSTVPEHKERELLEWAKACSSLQHLLLEKVVICASFHFGE